MSRMELIGTNVGRTRRTARSRRGTVLLMIVGVLALMAIIAVVYAAIAQADRRGAAAFAKANQIDDHIGQFKDYLADVIGSSRLNTWQEQVPGAGANVTRTMRAAWDYPGVDPAMRSRWQGANPLPGEVPYSPVGGAYTPWLSPSEPTRITTTALFDPLRPYLNARDWFSISNLAPDGRFVNLVNLRNNFRAEPGFGVDPLTGRSRMSRGLTLFAPDGNVWPSTSVQLPDGSMADPFVPQHWTMRQIHAYRPIRDLDRRSGAPDPGTDEYYPNQWADADGDGIGDSRWFEMVRVDPGNPLYIESLLPQDPGVRYFYAVKVTDNSGAINVNTATDQVRAPSYVPDVAYKLGLSPADVDLRGMLSMSSAGNRFVDGNQPVGYDRFQQTFPQVPNDPTNYFLNGRYNGLNARSVGHASYHALRTVIDTGVIPKPHPRQPPPGVSWDFLDVTIGSPLTRQRYYETIGAEPGGQFTGMAANITGVRSFGPFGIESEVDLRAYGNANDFQRRSDLEAVLDGRADKAPSTLPWFGPLRSNRNDLVERFNKGGTGNAARIDGWASDQAMAMSMIDIRHRISMLSGGSPFSSLTPASIPQADPNQIVEEELKVDVSKVLRLPRTVANARRFNDQDRQTYVRLLADALMPFRFDPVNQNPALNSWGSNRYGSGAGPWKRTVNYGQSAEFAYRSLIHLAVNTWDALDDDNTNTGDLAMDDYISGPSAVSIRLSQSPIGNRMLFPWLNVSLPSEQLAPSNGDLDGTEQLNIFGIEAQPFLTEVVTYAIYTDMPPQRVIGSENPGGDDEWNDRIPGPLPGDPPELAEVTIDLSRSARNVDYVGEIIAFQVTNPFDRKVELDGGGSQPAMKYYFEYAGNAYRLGEYNEQGRRFNTRIVLDPGQTKIFYCLSWSRAEIQNRIQVAQNRPGMPGPMFDLNTFLDGQFGVGRHIQTTMVDPKTGLPITASLSAPVYGVLDIHNENHTPRFGAQGATFSDDLRNGVMLWRVMRPASDPGEVYPNNLPTNDLMVDRMRDPLVPEDGSVPADPSLYFNFSAHTDMVADSEAGDDLSADPRDNTGFSAVFHGSIRRPNRNPADPPLAVGTMPPWCIEAKLDQVFPMGNPVRYNAREGSDRSLGMQTEYGNAGSGQPRFTTVANLASALGSSTTGALPQQIRNEPASKTGNDIRPSQSTAAGSNAGLPYPRVAVQIALGGSDLDGKERNPGLFSRVGDLLIPLAIGPYQEPKLGLNGETTFVRLEKQWTTLSEALAICSDYYSPPRTDGAGANRGFPLYHEACHENPNAQTPTLLDRGHLILDRYVPFIEPANANGLFDYGTDRPIGLGIPLALNVLDRFRMDSIGSTTKLAPGKVNINTMGLLNADAVSPLLAPDPNTTTVANANWMTTAVAASMNGPARVPLFNDPMHPAEIWDVSTSILSYRDKVSLPFRPRGGAFTNMFADFTGAASGNNQAVYGRRRNAFIHGVREEPGFRSVGELMAVRLRLPSGEVFPRADNNGIDRLGTLGPMETARPIQGYPGVTSTTVTWDRDGNQIINASDAPFLPANIQATDTYDGKLAIANSMLQSVSVRSDVFCVWFLVHGYTQSDVENLSPEDPLVPSIARRFVMVVDRSNVVRRGEKPKILLFEEVPL